MLSRRFTFTPFVLVDKTFLGKINIRGCSRLYTPYPAVVLCMDILYSTHMFSLYIIAQYKDIFKPGGNYLLD
jgi:hypothetical protein